MHPGAARAFTGRIRSGAASAISSAAFGGRQRQHVKDGKPSSRASIPLKAKCSKTAVQPQQLECPTAPTRIEPIKLVWVTAAPRLLLPHRLMP